MIRRLLTLIGKDVRIFFADPVAIGLGFVVPAVMIVVFGLVFGGSGGGGIDEIEVLAVNMDEGPAGARLLQALDDLDELRMIDTLARDTVALDSARARLRVASGRISTAIIVPSDFSAGLKAGQVRLLLLEDPSNPIAAGVVGGLLQQQAFSTFPGLMPMAMMNQNFGVDSSVAKSFTGDLRKLVSERFGVSLPESTGVAGMLPDEMILGRDPDTTGDTNGFSLGRAMENVFQVKREAVAGQNIVNPGIAQSVAGPAVMFMLFAVSGIAASLLREMRDGTANRLRITGARPGEVLVAKYFYAVLLGTFQLCVMMLYGRLLFGLDVFAHPGALLVMIIVTAVVMSSIALMIAALARTEEQATGYHVTIVLAMSAVGGAMFPSFMLPGSIKAIASITPVHWSMQGFLDIFWRDQSLPGIAGECAILLGMAAVMVTISVLVFRKRLNTELG